MRSLTLFGGTIQEGVLYFQDSFVVLSYECFPACVYMPYIHALYSQRPKEPLASQLQMIVSCLWRQELSSDHLEGHQMLLLLAIPTALLSIFCLVFSMKNILHG